MGNLRGQPILVPPPPPSKKNGHNPSFPLPSSPIDPQTNRAKSIMCARTYSMLILSALMAKSLGARAPYKGSLFYGLLKGKLASSI